jgi:hypothetical protein
MGGRHVLMLSCYCLSQDSARRSPGFYRVFRCLQRAFDSSFDSCIEVVFDPIGLPYGSSCAPGAFLRTSV